MVILQYSYDKELNFFSDKIHFEESPSKVNTYKKLEHRKKEELLLLQYLCCVVVVIRLDGRKSVKEQFQELFCLEGKVKQKKREVD